ncbi:MAG: tetratricopeptide repeat protein [Candidatus Omnitrophota bacterium]|nr:tetratricopeptide repeat protein [Candidatus Omnitrophota bacterium]
MPSASVKNNTRIFFFLVSFCLAQIFLFLNPCVNLLSAQGTTEVGPVSAITAPGPQEQAIVQPAPESEPKKENAGLISVNRVPELKKGTILIKEPSSPTAELSVSKAPPKEESLTELQKDARQYHAEGLEFQNNGELDSAMALYQKAVVLDPFYAVAYNDLGILYEANGLPQRAEESYIKAMNIDPQLLSAYSNLAMLYESRRDLRQAAYYWQKRAEMGLANDPWTQKAQRRFNDIDTVLSDRPVEDNKEKEAIELLAQVTNDKALLKKDDTVQAREYMFKARALYNKGEDVTALKTAIDAQQLDPANDEIEQFVEQLQHRILSR